MVNQNGNDKTKPNGSVKEEKQQASQEKKSGEQNVDATQQYKELQDRLLRLAAEFDNYKKRAAKDIENSKIAGKAELINKLLSVVDEFELAMIAISKINDESMAKGIEMVYANLIGTLKSTGLKEIPTNSTYNPYNHEVIMVQESDRNEGTILQTVKKGYLLNDVLLRPASVIIAGKKTDKK